MRPASHRPTDGLLVEERVPWPGVAASRPTLVVDADAGLLLDDNPAGWTAWGLDPATAAPPTAAAPLALYRSMPALQRVRDICKSQPSCSRRRETLTFWALLGLLRIDCQIEMSQSPAAGHAVSVQALEPIPPAGALSPVLRRNGGSADLEVARSE